MFNDQLDAAIELYTSTFPNSEVRNLARVRKAAMDAMLTMVKLDVAGLERAYDAA